MQCGYLKKSNNIVFWLFLLFFFVRDYMPFRVKTNDSHQRDKHKKIYCVKQKQTKKSCSVALRKETWLIFLNTFFVGGSLQVESAHIQVC